MTTTETDFEDGAGIWRAPTAEDFKPVKDGPVVPATERFWSVACPYCGSPVGAWCLWVEGNGARSTTVHLDRACVAIRQHQAHLGRLCGW